MEIYTSPFFSKGRTWKILHYKCYLTFEDLSTVLGQLESIMNSRPITPLFTDHNELSALTSGHFLIGSPLLALHRTIQNRKTLRKITADKTIFLATMVSTIFTSMQQRTKWQFIEQYYSQHGPLGCIDRRNFGIPRLLIGSNLLESK